MTEQKPAFIPPPECIDVETCRGFFGHCWFKSLLLTEVGYVENGLYDSRGLPPVMGLLQRLCVEDSELSAHARAAMAAYKARVGKA